MMNRLHNQNRLLRLCLQFALATSVFFSGFVLFEPGPYELIMVLLISSWVIFGLKLSRNSIILLGLFTIFNLGGLISMAQMPDFKQAPLYIAISYFLALTCVFITALVQADWRWLKSIFTGYVLAAIMTSLLGILGYLQLIPGSSYFTLYDRAKGAFNDPNVFAPFLILPVCWSIYSILTRPLKDCFGYWLALLILSVAIFLSFSRAGWGMFLIVIILLPLLLFIRSNQQQFRLKLIFLSIGAFLILIITLTLILQIPDIASIFSERARFDQDYDNARNGRFARHWLGLLLAMERPLGIGPLAFGPLFGEDTHNMWLKAALEYGWIGFAAFLTITVLTIAIGFRLMFRPRPWQPYLLCAYIAYLTHVVIGNVIDTDHWRHFYLLIGIIWGCAGLEYRQQISAIRPNLQQQSYNQSK